MRVKSLIARASDAIRADNGAIRERRPSEGPARPDSAQSRAAPRGKSGTSAMLEVGRGWGPGLALPGGLKRTRSGCKGTVSTLLAPGRPSLKGSRSSRPEEIPAGLVGRRTDSSGTGETLFPPKTPVLSTGSRHRPRTLYHPQLNISLLRPGNLSRVLRYNFTTFPVLIPDFRSPLHSPLYKTFHILSVILYGDNIL